MKTPIKFILFCLLICVFTNVLNAQEVEDPPEALTDQTWYLTKMIIDEEEMPFTPNEEVEYVELIIDEPNGNITGVGLNFCAGPGTGLRLEGVEEFYIGVLVFLANNSFLPKVTNSSCNLEENIILENIYFDEFWQNSDSYLGHDYAYPFHFYYTINQLEEHRKLIVINDNGYEAHFQNVPYLSVDKQHKSNLTIFPNPVQNHLYIENLTELVEIKIYNLSGKVLLSQEINEISKQVNLSQLSEGFYFYQIQQNGKGIKTGKLVKK